MSEQRRFGRVPFAMQTEMELAGETHPAMLVNISMKGALVESPCDVEHGAACSMKISLANSDQTMEFTGVVAHHRDGLTDIRFTCMDLDTMVHLRALLEINTGNPDKVLQELMTFADGE